MNATIVIRYVGERSLPLSENAIRQQAQDVSVINITPFIRAVEETFNIGSKSNLRWLIAVDADMVLNNNAIEKMATEANACVDKDPLLFKIDFLLRDKFRGRIYGCHLYNNAYSKIFGEAFSKTKYDPLTKRPESSVIASICKELNLSKKNSKTIVGTHDFEQYFKHLYVKYFNRSIKDKKSYEKIRKSIMTKQEATPEDYDFAIALAGLDDGIKETKMYTDASNYPNIDDLLSKMGITEKNTI